MDPHAASVRHGPSVASNQQATIKSTEATSEELDIRLQNEAEDALFDLNWEVDQNVLQGKDAKTKPLKPQKKETKPKGVERKEKGVFTRKEMDKLEKDASGFSQGEGNREYHLPPQALIKLALRLGDSITPDTPPDELVRMIRNELAEGAKLPDVSQVDKTFDFLLEITKKKLESSTGLEAVNLEKLYQTIASTKMRHYEAFKADIEAAYNIIGAANVLVTENRTTGETLDHLREMINNPQDVHTKHKYYRNKSYDHKMLRTEFKLLFNYMGSLVKEKLEKPHLKQLMEEIKVLQSILGVYRQSQREISSMVVHLDKSVGLFDEKGKD
ncbi:MAG: hypothetical protein ACHQUC_09905 [Chlamydiales bacterium]